MDRSRTVVALVACALIGLAAWTYSSGSVATGSASGPATTAGSATTSPPTTARPSSTQSSAPTTAPAPTTTVKADPQVYAAALFGYWLHRDRAAADKVAAPAVVHKLWVRRPFEGEKWVGAGCTGAAGSTFCTWISDHRRFVMQVRNATGGQRVLVVDLKISRA